MESKKMDTMKKFVSEIRFIFINVEIEIGTSAPRFHTINNKLNSLYKLINSCYFKDMSKKNKSDYDFAQIHKEIKSYVEIIDEKMNLIIKHLKNLSEMCKKDEFQQILNNDFSQSCEVYYGGSDIDKQDELETNFVSPYCSKILGSEELISKPVEKKVVTLINDNFFLKVKNSVLKAMDSVLVFGKEVRHINIFEGTSYGKVEVFEKKMEQILSQSDTEYQQIDKNFQQFKIGLQKQLVQIDNFLLKMGYLRRFLYILATQIFGIKLVPIEEKFCEWSLTLPYCTTKEMKESIQTFPFKQDQEEFLKEKPLVALTLNEHASASSKFIFKFVDTNAIIRKLIDNQFYFIHKELIFINKSTPKEEKVAQYEKLFARIGTIDSFMSEYTSFIKNFFTQFGQPGFIDLSDTPYVASKDQRLANYQVGGSDFTERASVFFPRDSAAPWLENKGLQFNEDEIVFFYEGFDNAVRKISNQLKKLFNANHDAYNFEKKYEAYFIRCYMDSIISTFKSFYNAVNALAYFRNYLVKFSEHFIKKWDIEVTPINSTKEIYNFCLELPVFLANAANIGDPVTENNLTPSIEEKTSTMMEEERASTPSVSASTLSVEEKTPTMMEEDASLALAISLEQENQQPRTTHYAIGLVQHAHNLTKRIVKFMDISASIRNFVDNHLNDFETDLIKTTEFGTDEEKAALYEKLFVRIGTIDSFVLDYNNFLREIYYVFGVENFIDLQGTEYVDSADRYLAFYKVGGSDVTKVISFLFPSDSDKSGLAKEGLTYEENEITLFFNCFNDSVRWISCELDKLHKVTCEAYRFVNLWTDEQERFNSDYMEVLISSMKALYNGVNTVAFFKNYLVKLSHHYIKEWNIKVTPVNSTGKIFDFSLKLPVFLAKAANIGDPVVDAIENPFLFQEIPIPNADNNSTSSPAQVGSASSAVFTEVKEKEAVVPNAPVKEGETQFNCPLARSATLRLDFEEAEEMEEELTPSSKRMKKDE